jgi:hypothetical protein
MIKHGSAFPLSVAAACLALITPQLSRAANPTAGNSAMNSLSASPSARQEAAQMVSGQAHLLKTLDGKKTQAGRQFEAVVDHTIHLKDGTELPHGTVLIGRVAKDQMDPAGPSQLALRFTEAKLRDGKTVPIRAMIAGTTGPSSYAGYMAENTAPPSWSRGILQVDEEGALGDVDLHSRIAGANSGTFVSTKKDDVKLRAGSQFSLAITAQSNPNMASMKGGV